MKKFVCPESGTYLTSTEASLKNQPLKNDSLLLKVLLPLIPIALFAAFFLPTASSDVRYSYRDVAYYYYPLFEQIQKCWESGQFPWWNPQVNLGQPLAGDPTSCVFYPVKIIFFLSSLQICSYALCFKIYLWFHVVLAFYSAFRLSRFLGTSNVGSVIAGVSYAFSGQVLFQYTNVIYLVGSAWAPLHFVYALAFFKAPTLRRQITALCKLSAILALTILGGEPQIVYITILTSTAVSLGWKRPTPKTNNQSERRCGNISKSLFFLLGTCVLTGLLAAIQILPSLEIVARSTRSNVNSACSIWETPSAYCAAKNSGLDYPALHKEFYQGLLCQDLSQNGRNRSIYRFSVGPWRWLEFLFPNVGGKQFPRSTRWFETFPEELSVWTPTLYFGVLPCLLSLASMKLRRRASDQTRTDMSIVATWLVLFGLLGALGGFGLAWAFRFLRAVCHGVSPDMTFANGDPVGGLYWILNLVVPKFVEFRYPAKLLTISAIGFSSLAGMGWDNERNAVKLKILAWTVFTLAVAGIGVFLLWGQRLFESLQVPINPLFGPFQPRLSYKIVLGSLIQTAIVVSVSYAVLELQKRLTGGEKRKNSWLAGLVLLIVAGDVYFANHWLITASPSRLFEATSGVVSDEFQSDLAKSLETDPPTRVYRYPIWFPPMFQTKSSPRRVTERVVWDVATLYPMYPLAQGTAIVDVRGAVMEKEYAKFIDAAFSGANLDANLAFIDVRYVLGPRFWIERISPSSNSPNSTVNNDWSVFFKKLETPTTRVRLFRNDRPVESCPSDNVNILSYKGNEIILLLTSSEPSDLIVSEQYWPDWRLELIPVSETEFLALEDAKRRSDLSAAIRQVKKSSDLSIQRVEPAFGFLRKASVPQGRYCAVMSYRPRKLYIGAAVSGVFWVLLFLIPVITSGRRTS